MAPYFKERCLAVNGVEVLVLPERKVSRELKEAGLSEGGLA